MTARLTSDYSSQVTGATPFLDSLAPAVGGANTRRQWNAMQSAESAHEGRALTRANTTNSSRITIPSGFKQAVMQRSICSLGDDTVRISQLERREQALQAFD